MKAVRFLLLALVALIAQAGESVAPGATAGAPNPPAKDSVTITGESGFRATTSPGAAHPDRIGIKAHIRYNLTSEARGRISLALNDRGEVDFSTFDSAKVERGQGELELRAAVKMFEQDTLRCIVLLTKIGAAAGDEPLAATDVAIDLRELRSTKLSR